MGKSVVVVATATVVAVVAVYCFAGCQGLSDKEREQFCAFSNTWGCAEDCTKICEENTTICGGSCQEGKIVSLDLTAKNLKSVDPSVQNMKDLQSLTLKDNHIADLPNALGNMTSLLEIDASSNLLTGLPKSIGDLKSLKKLNIHGNRAYMLKFIGSLSSLEHLDLGSNSLKTLPKSMKSLSSLTYLDISKNDLDCFQLKGWPEFIRSSCDQKAQRDKFGRTKTGIVLSSTISVCIVVTIVVIIVLNIFCMKKDPKQYKTIN